MTDYDVIICVGWKDVIIVKKTIKYIRKNLQANKIYLIVSNNDKKHFDDNYCAQNYLVVIDEDKLVNGLTFKTVTKLLNERSPLWGTGWYFQQFLKIGFALSEYAKDYYLIWDADTLPLTQIPFEKDGKLLYTMKREYHKPYFEVTERLWGLKKQNDFSFIAEHMIIKTQIMRELIEVISPRAADDCNWVKLIIGAMNVNDPNAFSEFETYGTYVTQHYPNLYMGRNLNSWRNAGYVFGRNIRQKDIELLSIDFDIVSLEAWGGRFFPNNCIAKIQETIIKMKRYIYMKKHGIALYGSLVSKIVNIVCRRDKLVKL